MLLAVFLLSILSSAASAQFCRRPNVGLLVVQNVSDPGIGMNGFAVPLFNDIDDCQFRADAPPISPNGASIPSTAQAIQFIQPAFEDDIGNDLDETSLGLFLEAMKPQVGHVPTADEMFFDFVLCTVVTGTGQTLSFGGLQHGEGLEFDAALPIVSYQCRLDFE
ncbi:hypothetical protein B0T22DRAFT_448764 [Podospora appendiculata]|uniref:Uncharacterized protein n=1 Tax=Podospora appendiculata TaxID=314037 RepID=A0AAE1CFV3_9PEZI|nr:hypothetical protein B0T22DRAFT_448764 [Podospora appendiculata]